MNATQRLIAQAKTAINVQSDYALAKALRVTRQAVSFYQAGKRQLDNETAFRIAELLSLDPAIVIAEIEADKATEPGAREAWNQRLKRLGGVAAMWGIFAVLSASPAPAEARSAAMQHSGISAPHNPDLTVFRTAKTRARRCIAAFGRRIRHVFQNWTRPAFAAPA